MEINNYQLSVIKESAQDNLKILKQLQLERHRVSIEVRDTEEVLTIIDAIEKGK